MTSRHPGALGPDDLIAYIDGEASGNVREHVRECAECAAVADEYASIQRGLRTRLVRLDCPSPQQLGEYELGLLNPEERSSTAAHVLGCPHCGRELRQLRAFMASEPAPRPVGAVERLRRIIATLLPTQGTTVAAGAGLRGTGAQFAPMFQADDITLSLASAPVGAIEALLWREGADHETLVGRAVTLIAADGPAAIAVIDESGGFSFVDVVPGVYRLEIALDDVLVAVEDVHIAP